MAQRFALVCSGQGGQSLSMLDSWQADPLALAAREHWARWQAQQQVADWAQVLRQPENLFHNGVAQSVIVAYGVALWQALAAHLPAPTLVAGYSVGELTAYHVAGSLDAEQVLAMVRVRAQWMDAQCNAQCNQTGPATSGFSDTSGISATSVSIATNGGHAMLALTGLAAASLPTLLAQYGAHLAIDNGAASVVLGGWRNDLLALTDAATALGARAQMLALQVASHTPLMQGAQQPWLQRLQAAHWQAPICPVLAGIDGQRISQPDQACISLAQQLSQPVRWAACMDALAQSNLDAVLELGPGSALARMMQARHPQLPCRSLADFRSLGGALRWLERQL